MQITRPVQSQPGDLLVLFLSRTDDYLPLQLEGFTSGPACFKTNDWQDTCHAAADCTDWDGDYCLEFDGNPCSDGADLATAVFYRTVQQAEAEDEEPQHYTFDLQCWGECKPAWAILIALRGANNQFPIVDSATISFDDERGSKFPSVSNASPGDMLLLSMTFDDGLESGIDVSTFRPPEGTERLSYVVGEDEASFLFAQELSLSGATGQKYTTGPGIEYVQKDAMISLIIRKMRAFDDR